MLHKICSNVCYFVRASKSPAPTCCFYCILQEGASCTKVAKQPPKAASAPVSCSFLFSSPDSPLSSCFRVVSNKTPFALPHRRCGFESGRQCSHPRAFPGPDTISGIVLRNSQQIKVVLKKTGRSEVLNWNVLAVEDTLYF